jgi:plastocyanin
MKRNDLIIVPVLIIIACSFVAGCVGNNNNYANAPVPTSQIVTPVATAASATSPSPVIQRNVTIDLTAKDMTFNRSTIAVPAGATVMVNFQNLEARGSSQVTGIAHNFAVYTNAGATTTIFRGDIITGGQNITYQFTAPAQQGTYFFRCDVHPAVMTGQLIVT